jgi:hypothetical protein
MTTPSHVTKTVTVHVTTHMSMMMTDHVTVHVTVVEEGTTHVIIAWILSLWIHLHICLYIHLHVYTLKTAARATRSHNMSSVHCAALTAMQAMGMSHQLMMILPASQVTIMGMLHAHLCTHLSI